MKVENGIIKRQQATFKIIIKYSKKNNFEINIERYSSIKNLSDSRISPQDRKKILDCEGFIGEHNAYKLTDIHDELESALRNILKSEKKVFNGIVFLTSND